MIIDMHAHTSSRELFDLHVKYARIQDLEDFAAKYGISKIALMATYFPFKGKGLKNADLLERIRGHDLFLVFGSLDIPNRFQEGICELEKLAQKHLISGIKLYPGYQEFYCSDPAVFPVYELAQKYGLPVMLHGGELHHCCPEEKRKLGQTLCGRYECPLDHLAHLSHPEQVAEAALHFQKVLFIVSHLSNPYFDDLRKVMERCENVCTDISGQWKSRSEEDTPEYKQEIGREIMKFLELKNGLQRMLFASDFPIQSYEDSIELIKKLSISLDEKEMIFSKNALRILNAKK